MSKKKLIAGISFLLIAALIVLNSMNVLGDLNVWTIIISCILIPIFIEAVVKLRFAGIFFPMAIEVILFDKELGLEAFTPWPVLLIALFLSIGFHLIFGSLIKRHRHNGCNQNGWNWNWNFTDGHQQQQEYTQYGQGEQCVTDADYYEEKGGEGYFMDSGSFTSKTRYVNSADFSRGDVNMDFSNITIYLDKAQVPSGNCCLNIQADFSTVTIYVPSNWTVRTMMSHDFSAINGIRDGEIIENSIVTLTLTGNADFSTLNVKRL